jgi:hypothetical protein
MGEMPDRWSDFFVAEVGAAAALSGLVIVAISINLHNILANPHVLPGRAGEALTTLVGALLVASVSLIPHQPGKILGTEILAAALIVLSVGLTFQIKSIMHMRDQPIDWWLPRLIIGLGTAVPIGVGGIMLILGMPDGLYWAAAGVLLSLVAGVFNTWVLLVEIRR